MIPVDDYKDHIEVKSCWCNPIVDEDNNRLIIHNSLDKREFYEDGRIKKH